ncbi:hypothetical protein POM88_036825 [Heracleum sosnowskyi]|uniref:F-box associated beta-propeller type 1 domain-containing protein n=1 Tax=Heracleum sosnowskyi TaxID=360622 RepID=A0AAD8HPY4_9APIA|nr:hypothetical protein POM88_036825 [Heracleum sosnowskyi]
MRLSFLDYSRGLHQGRISKLLNSTGSYGLRYGEIPRFYFETTVESGDAHVFVYKAKENEWKSVEFCPYAHSLIRPVISIFFRGYLHWFAKDVNDSLLFIATFDLDTKKFSRVPLPDRVFNLNLKLLDSFSRDGRCLGCFAGFQSERGDALELMEVLGLPSEFLIGMTYVDSLVSPRKKDWKKKNT